LLLLAGVTGVTLSPAQAAQPARAPGLLQFASGAHVLGFAANGMYAATGTHALHVDFVDANNVQPLADTSASPATSLRTGADGKAAPLSRVTYADLWPGISLTYDAPQGTILRSTYTLQPGADPADIRLRYNAPLTLNEDGALRSAFETGALTESAPIAWQEIDGQHVPVAVRFSLSPPGSGDGDEGQTVTFALGKYDSRYPLTIDPGLEWNTFLGGPYGTVGGKDEGLAIAVDGSGNTYVTGYSKSAWSCSTDCTVNNFVGPIDPFVAKLDPNGNLIWNTFGYGRDDIVVDGSGNIYVTGGASVAKMDPNGNLIWNYTSLGDGASYGIAVDGSGNVYVTGYSGTTWGSPVNPHSGGDYQDAFVAELDSSGTLLWNTFLGGSGGGGYSGGWDEGRGIAVDASGNVYVTGYSGYTWGSPRRAFTKYNDAFAAKLNPSGTLIWNTFLGGSGTSETGFLETGQGIAVDGGGNVYVTGTSPAAWSCSPTCTVRPYTAGCDAFAAKLDSSSGDLTWNTFLGGSGEDNGFSIAMDGGGNVYMTGFSNADWGSPLRAYSSGYDGFAAKIDSSGALIWNSFLGGNGALDKGYGIAVGGTSGMNVYVAGYSDATWGAPVRPHNNDGCGDAFAAKIPFTPNAVTLQSLAVSSSTPKVSVVIGTIVAGILFAMAIGRGLRRRRSSHFRWTS